MSSEMSADWFTLSLSIRESRAHARGGETALLPERRRGQPRASEKEGARGGTMGSPTPSKVALDLFLLHRRGGVVVDHASLPLGRPRQQHLLDDRRQRVRVALDRAGERVAAERAEADLFP